MLRWGVERLGATAPYYGERGTEMVSKRAVLLLGWDPRMNVLWLLDDDLLRKV